MSKSLRILLICIVSALFASFSAIFLLTMPLGKRSGVLPPLVLYVTGIVFAAICLAAGTGFLLLRFRRLTKRGKKYYDSKQ